MFPAPAGINRRRVCGGGFMISVPRASGDKPPYAFDDVDGQECSPRQRG
ncbi:hypothetical protein CIT292_09836 [Citrobacter youngae ATCC 29220]|uniref:Uncharacterized protein n=1 Tax=Citrobacter youngae ATCC 29220 TaxID=500640 RepID=D4BH29_9ENTR|nr:hypothetical protein CIT292_09836 [Citrobacter youngae ATCC 29220]